MCMIEISPTIETRRLTLRAPTPHDAPRLATLLNDFDIARMTSRLPHPYGLADAGHFIGLTQGEDPRTDRSFLVELDDEGVVGGIGFNARPDGSTEVGYWVGRDWWGRGIATEALQGALVWAGRDWKKRFVIAGHFDDNPASGQVLVKAGFLYTGEVQPRRSIARNGDAPTRMMVWLA